MAGLSTDPNGTGQNQGELTVQNALIYAESLSSDPNVFPVKGYIVGGTNTIWSYSDCIAPDFGSTEPHYEKLFSSPGAGQKVGFISRIENEANSCDRKEVTAVTSVTGITGTGRSDTMVDKLWQSEFDFESFELALPIDDFMMELAEASDSSIAIGDWEEYLAPAF